MLFTLLIKSFSHSLQSVSCVVVFSLTSLTALQMSIFTILIPRFVIKNDTCPRKELSIICLYFSEMIDPFLYDSSAVDEMILILLTFEMKSLFLSLSKNDWSRSNPQQLLLFWMNMIDWPDIVLEKETNYCCIGTWFRGFIW